MHRAGTRRLEQTGIICRAIQTILARTSFRILQNYIALIRYERDDELTALF